ncbi:hypothetical protein C900_02469 [Fulvivirga imtechensis AK7]|uniref:Uncharacterized protein n=1 Tax=Fulvivirga imtechensis AK7 TaxID=1237149 RepID=L8JVC3_9BACT|nr:hypothetical protein C900_02469 [Fulvivirga imtechensis AK7]
MRKKYAAALSQLIGNDYINIIMIKVTTTATAYLKIIFLNCSS